MSPSAAFCTTAPVLPHGFDVDTPMGDAEELPAYLCRGWDTSADPNAVSPCPASPRDPQAPCMNVICAHECGPSTPFAIRSCGPTCPTAGTDLDGLPHDLVALAAGKLDPLSVASATSVSKPWMMAFGATITSLAPNCIDASPYLPRRFPELQILDLSSCAGSSLTDAAVAQIAGLTRLRVLRIRAGHCITDHGLAALSGLLGARLSRRESERGEGSKTG